MMGSNISRSARTQCGVYCFDWKEDRFNLVKRVLVDLTKAERK